MDIRLIGIIKNSGRELIGCRLYELESKDIKDVLVNSIINGFYSSNLSIKGLGVRGGRLVGTNGNLDRYPTIINNKILGKSPLIILSQYVQKDCTLGYKVIDWKGQIIDISLGDAIKYANENGIANGAVKTLSNKSFISAIVGEYDKIEVKIGNNPLEDIETTIWSVEDFKEYMNTNGYKYKIDNLCGGIPREGYVNACIIENIPILKYPDGVQKISWDEISGTKDNVEVLIVPPSVNTIDWDIFIKLDKLRRIVVQEGLKELKFRGNVRRSNVEELVLPKSLESIQSGFSDMSKLKKLDIYNTNLISCRDSFNNLNIKELILPNSLRYTKGSFRGLENIEKIKFPEDIEIIGDSSFSYAGISNLDLSQCNKLEKIESAAFFQCIKLKEVRLPDNITIIYEGAFSECKNIEKLNIPRKLQTLRWRAFKGVKMDRFIISDTFKSLGSSCFVDDIIIEIEEGLKKVRSGVIDGGYSTIVLPESIEEIQPKAFKNIIDLKTINIPNSVRYIGDMAFGSCSNLRHVDLENCNELREIGEGAFKNSGVCKIILPEGLEVLGPECFRECWNLTDVVLPKSLNKIGRLAFQVSRISRSGKMFYVYKGSKGLDYCRRNKFPYVIISSLDDVGIRDVEDMEISESKKAKIRLLISGSEEHKRLLTDKYIDYADKLLAIYNHINGEAFRGDLQLNRDKFTDHSVRGIKVLEEVILGMKIDNKVEEENGHRVTNRFINLSNLITSIFELNTTPFTKLGLAYLEKNCSVQYKTVYKDEYNCIIVLEVNPIGVDVGTYRSNVVVIIMNGRIKFLTVLDADKEVRNKLEVEVLRWLDKDHSYRKKSNGSIADFVSKGDIVTLSSGRHFEGEFNKICGINLPLYIQIKVVANILDNFIIIGRGEGSKKIQGKSIGGSAGYSSIMDLMCRETGKVITTHIYFMSDTGDIIDITDIDRLDRIIVTDVKNLENMSDDTVRRVTNKLSVECAKRLYMYEGIADYTNKLSKIPGAYDNEQCIEWELGQLINKKDINNVKELDEKTILEIMNTSFFVETRRSLGGINKISDRSKDKNIVLKDGTMITEIRLIKTFEIEPLEYKIARFVTVIDRENTQELYMSNRSLEDIFYMLKAMKKVENSPMVLKDKVYSEDEYNNMFVTVRDTLSNIRYKRNNKYYGLLIAVSKGNGGVYMIGREIDESKEYDEKLYCELLRFKTLELAARHYKTVYTDKTIGVVGEPVYSYIDIAYTLIKRYRIGADEVIDVSMIDTLRSAIMSGLPNMHSIIGTDIDLWDSLAKQSPED